MSKIVFYKIFIVIFYLVGLVGIFIPASASFFIALTPFALLLSGFLLSLYHPDWSKKTVVAFLAIFITGFVVEFVGVNTGQIFGNYMYGKTLGYQIFNTPLMIGVNWLLMVYLTASVVESFELTNVLKIVVSASLMVLYDFVLELMAPRMDMWYWQNNTVPLQNYVAWFALALAFQALLKVAKIKTRNPLALIILLTQFLFFVILLLKK